MAVEELGDSRALVIVIPGTQNFVTLGPPMRRWPSSGSFWTTASSFRTFSIVSTQPNNLSIEHPVSVTTYGRLHAALPNAMDGPSSFIREILAKAKVEYEVLAYAKPDDLQCSETAVTALKLSVLEETTKYRGQESAILKPPDVFTVLESMRYFIQDLSDVELLDLLDIFRTNQFRCLSD
ncbi:MAG: hypothetical protein M1822_004923 [Bathelium mastoideum]|nr:MAG: hypothetical protein M1822_004923 [Bathelium mastoideum]